MIDHFSTYATEFSSTKAFYTAALAELGYSLQAEMTLDSDPDVPGRRACAFGPKGRSVFWVIEVRDAASPRHLAFVAKDRRCVAAFHEAGLAAGGQDLGAPGLRPIYHEHYYGSFLTDANQNVVSENDAECLDESTLFAGANPALAIEAERQRQKSENETDGGYREPLVHVDRGTPTRRDQALGIGANLSQFGEGHLPQDSRDRAAVHHVCFVVRK